MARCRTGTSPRLWPLIALSSVATATWMVAAGLTLDPTSVVLPAATCGGLEGLAALYRVSRPDPRLAAALSGTAQLVAFSAVAACLSYAVAATAGPLWDGVLLAADRALSFDWAGYLAAVASHPMLCVIYRAAYQSLTVQLLLVVTLFGFTGRFDALRRFLLAFVVLALGTVLVSAVAPATTMYDVLHLRPDAFGSLDPAAAAAHTTTLTALRSGTLHVVSLGRLEGVVAFPSLHAALGVLLAASLWCVPGLRWPALALNAVLVMATPLVGGHFLCDVIAGCALGGMVHAATHSRMARAVAAQAVEPGRGAPAFATPRP